MGLFDRIEIDESHGLPIADEWQTKDTPQQYQGLYRIDKDGYLLHQIYDTEDRSDPNATGLAALAGCMTRVNKRWVKIDFRGAISFYTDIGGEWYEYSALFNNGRLIDIKVIESPEVSP